MVKKQEIFLLIICLLSSAAVVLFNIFSSPAVYDRVKIEMKEQTTTVSVAESEITKTSVNGQEPILSGEKININKAGKEELLTIKYIGEKKAEAIIKYRKENGDFNSIDEIKEVPGIGEKIYQKIKGNIEV
ncbi:MAG: helix-hairpin-helix domain-containing protein [Clostridia bacterium]|nr:helix-hairpin-helix domain-containing protein [Clostridia bacterium]